MNKGLRSAGGIILRRESRSSRGKKKKTSPSVTLSTTNPISLNTNPDLYSKWQAAKSLSHGMALEGVKIFYFYDLTSE
jgi:hypothetical protein